LPLADLEHHVPELLDLHKGLRSSVPRPRSPAGARQAIMTGSLTLSACALIPPPVQRRTPGQVWLTRATLMATTGGRDNGPLSGLPPSPFVPKARLDEPTSSGDSTLPGRVDGIAGMPNWEPNWMPTATVAQPHPATQGHVIPGQAAYPATSAII